MANKRISELEELPEISNEDLSVVVDLSTFTTKKASMGNLRTFFVNDLDERLSELEIGSKTFSEIITLTSTSIVSKKINLTKTPNLSYSIVILPRGGCAQFPDEDFVVDGSIVSWDGYDLDNLLEVGDVLQVTYSY